MIKYLYLYISISVVTYSQGCSAASPTEGSDSWEHATPNISSSLAGSSLRTETTAVPSWTDKVATVYQTTIVASSTRKPGPGAVFDPKYVRQYEREFRDCKSQVVPRANPRELLDPYVLASAHAVFGVDGFGDLTVEDELGQGMYGKVFSFYETSVIILKGAKSDHGRDDLCWERSLQKVLDGLNGGAPRDYPITRFPSQFDPLFRSRVLVMERRGDAEWSDVVVEENVAFFTRFAKLLTIVRDLHQTGFIHDDIKGCNIRVSTYDPEDVTLIDFGQAIPFIDSDGNHLPNVSRKRDLVNLVVIARAIRGPKSWLDQFAEAVDQESDQSDFEYNDWISNFKGLTL